jgi:phosphonate transport system ATP-binding protein
MTPAAFELRSVGVRFGGTTALAAVDLRIAPGERVALIGPSGAGKSSLLSLLNGTLVPSEGTVRALGRDLAQLRSGELRRLRRAIGTIHQQHDLVGPLRVVHNVNAGQLGRWPLWRAAWSLLSPRGIEQVSAALQRVGIAGKLNERTDRLSGGEQQRVAIARVLVQDPAAILADEPIASLDPERGRDVVDLLVELGQERQTTLVVSLHDVEIALERFQRIVGLRAGEVVIDAAPDEISPAAIAKLYELEREGAP